MNKECFQKCANDFIKYLQSNKKEISYFLIYVVSFTVIVEGARSLITNLSQSRATKELHTAIAAESLSGREDIVVGVSQLTYIPPRSVHVVLDVVRGELPKTVMVDRNERFRKNLPPGKRAVDIPQELVEEPEPIRREAKNKVRMAIIRWMRDNVRVPTSDCPCRENRGPDYDVQVQFSDE